MGGLLLGAGLMLLLIGFLVTQSAGRKRVAAGLPLNSRVRVVYDDSRAGWRTVEKPLFARAYGLTGKPDYVLHDRRTNAWIPVEVKPTRYADEPYDSDRMQLAAYCLLLEEDEQWAITPPYGLLRYANHTFRIDYNDDLHAELLATLAEMRDLRTALPAMYFDDVIEPVLDQSRAVQTTIRRSPILPLSVYPMPQHDMSARCRACRYRNICWGTDKR